MALWNRFLHRLRLARGLSFLDWLVVFEAWWTLVVYYAALRWMSLERLTRTRAPEPNQSRAHLESARRLHRLVGLAARLHLLPMTCLVQSLALRWMLNRRGMTSSLAIGARRDAGQVRAHAWLEMDGETVGETDDVGGIFQLLRRDASS